MRPRTYIAFFALTSFFVAGCFMGTPKQELRKMGAKITVIDDDRAVRISLRRKDASMGDLMIATALCYNHSEEYSELRELDLSKSRVTDEGLEWLTMNAQLIQGLRILDLLETEVSNEAVAELQAAIPNCRIIR